MRMRTASSAAAVALLVMTAMAAPEARADAAFAPQFVQQLQAAKEIYVATQRKDGSRSQVVPVWFGYMDGAVWFTTSPTSHKGKRVKSGSPMFVSATGPDGPFIRCKAAIVKDPQAAEQLGAMYSQKYWIAWLGLFRPSRSRVESGKVILLKLTPAE